MRMIQQCSAGRAIERPSRSTSRGPIWSLWQPHWPASSFPLPQQQYGCPHDAACLLIAALSQPSLVGGQAGAALLGVVSGALLLALFSLVRPQRPLFLVGLALSLIDPGPGQLRRGHRRELDLQLQDPFPVTFEVGFYLATIGCASASLMALLLLVVGDPFHPGKLQRKTLVACAYPVFMTICLVGLLVPFVQQGCPAPRCIAGKLALPNDLLAQSQQGLALLALVLAGLLVGGVTIRRLSTPILLVQLCPPRRHTGCDLPGRSRSLGTGASAAT